MRIAGIFVLIVGLAIAGIMWLYPAQTAFVGQQFQCPGPPIDILFTAQPLTDSPAANELITGCQTAKTRRMTIGSAVAIPIVAIGCALLIAGRRRPA